MYKITFKRSAEKEIQKLPSSVIIKIVLVIEGLSINPRPSGSKNLKEAKRISGGSVLGIIESFILLQKKLK